MESSHRAPSGLPSRETVIPTRKHLDYALGYIALNLFADARAELALIKPADRETPEVLLIEIELAMAKASWARVIKLATRAASAIPSAERPWIAWAYALREKQRIADARDVLLRGERVIKDPTPLVDYNLSCYFCLLGQLPEARRRLKRACDREPDWKKEAGADPDLAGLR